MPERQTRKTIQSLIWQSIVKYLAEVTDCVESIPEGSFAVKGELPIEVLSLMKEEQVGEYLKATEPANCKNFDLSTATEYSKVTIPAACFATALNAYSKSGKLKFDKAFLTHSGNEGLFSEAEWKDIHGKIDLSAAKDFQLQQLHDIAKKVPDDVNEVAS